MSWLKLIKKKTNYEPATLEVPTVSNNLKSEGAVSLNIPTMQNKAPTQPWKAKKNPWMNWSSQYREKFGPELLSAIETARQNPEFSNLFDGREEGLKNFLISISGDESSGNKKVVNDAGYLGFFQFNPTYIGDYTLDPNMEKDEYLNSTQDQVNAKLRQMKEHIREWKRLDSQIPNPSNYSLSGKLAASHLLGVGGIRDKGWSGIDGYGTTADHHARNNDEWF